MDTLSAAQTDLAVNIEQFLFAGPAGFNAGMAVIAAVQPFNTDVFRCNIDPLDACFVNFLFFVMR